MTRDTAAGHSTVLVIKVWRESGTPNPFRARVTYGCASDEAPTTLVTADSDEVVDTVRRWLTDLGRKRS